MHPVKYFSRVYVCIFTHTNTETHLSLWENGKGPVFYYRKIESEASFSVQYG